MQNTFNSSNISTFAYANDAVGRRIQRLDTLAAFPSPLTNSFSYNTRSELTSAIMGSNAFGYAYDPIGNRLVSSNDVGGV